MVAPTATRVQEQTDADINERIRRETRASVERHAAAGPHAIAQRLDELDREWDVERTLELNFAVVVLTGLGLGALVDRRWYAFPAVAAGFMIQHVLHGWCPPVPVFRRLGFRTAREIEDDGARSAPPGGTLGSRPDWRPPRHSHPQKSIL